MHHSSCFRLAKSSTTSADWKTPSSGLGGGSRDTRREALELLHRCSGVRRRRLSRLVELSPADATHVHSGGTQQCEKLLSFLAQSTVFCLVFIWQNLHCNSNFHALISPGERFVSYELVHECTLVFLCCEFQSDFHFLSQTETFSNLHNLAKRAVDFVRGYRPDPEPNFRLQRSQVEQLSADVVPWQQRPTIRSSAYLKREYDSEVPFPDKGFFKEGKVERIETKEYRIFEPTEERSKFSSKEKSLGLSGTSSAK